MTTLRLKCWFGAEVYDSMAWKHEIQRSQCSANLVSDENVRATKQAKDRGAHHFFKRVCRCIPQSRTVEVAECSLIRKLRVLPNLLPIQKFTNRGLRGP